jgi:hypothetical protein
MTGCTAPVARAGPDCTFVNAARECLRRVPLGDESLLGAAPLLASGRIRERMGLKLQSAPETWRGAAAKTARGLLGEVWLRPDPMQLGITMSTFGLKAMKAALLRRVLAKYTYLKQEYGQHGHLEATYQHLFLREHQPGVDDDNVVGHLHRQHVLANFAQSTQGNNSYLASHSNGVALKQRKLLRLDLLCLIVYFRIFSD